MPLFFQQDVNDDTRLAVWQIGEEEDFFRKLAIPQRDVAHPLKRLQHLSGRYLLRYLFPAFPAELIRIADTRKPYLEDEAFHFSISHCSSYAAAIVSRNRRVGVDIEVVTDKAVRIRKKFASDEEWAMVHAAFSAAGALPHPDGDALLATLIWSCKEAAFKWFGAGEVDFKLHMPIEACTVMPSGISTIIRFQKEEQLVLTVESRVFGNLWLSYVVA